MTTAFLRAVSLEGRAPGPFSGTIDASWYQGRGAFGGLLAAMLVRAMTEAIADEARVLRSITVHFCAPAEKGPVSIPVEVVRTGSRVTHALARVVAGGLTTTLATASFGKARSGGAYVRAAMPEVEPPSKGIEVPGDLVGIPTFFQHIDARFCGPTMPFSGASVPEIAAWVRLREPAAVDAAVAALLLDALPPAITATFDRPRPVASVDFTVQLFEDPSVRAHPAGDYHLVTVRSRWAGGGYTEEMRDLWSPAGVLLGQCRQLIALL